MAEELFLTSVVKEDHRLSILGLAKAENNHEARKIALATHPQESGMANTCSLQTELDVLSSDYPVYTIASNFNPQDIKLHSHDAGPGKYTILLVHTKENKTGTPTADLYLALADNHRHAIKLAAETIKTRHGENRILTQAIACDIAFLGQYTEILTA